MKAVQFLIELEKIMARGCIQYSPVFGMSAGHFYVEYQQVVLQLTYQAHSKDGDISTLSGFWMEPCPVKGVIVTAVPLTQDPVRCGEMLNEIIQNYKE